MWVLGINGPPIGWHDGAACLVDGTGKVWAMAEEERFTRSKHALRTYPEKATQFCLRQAGIELEDLDAVAVGWDLPVLQERYGGSWGIESPAEFMEQIFGRRVDWRKRPELVCVPHHRAHALSAYFASGFENAAILVNDGNGEDEAISIYEARDGGMPVRREVWARSHSLGYLYDAACRVLNLSFLEAGKTMGLAAYGRAAGIEPWPLLGGEGTEFEPPFSIGTAGDYDQIVPAWEKEIRKYLPGEIRTPTEDLADDQTAIQVAWSAQSAVETVVRDLVAHSRSTGIEQVCLAGGVALNCSANGLLPDPIYVPPVPHDAGGALGAAWAVAPPRNHPGELLSPYLGSEVGPLGGVPGDWSQEPADPKTVARRIERGEIGGIASGRAEVGPRALGHRSIIARADSVEIRDRVNRLKRRELWRPLAPVAQRATAAGLWSGPLLPQQYMLAAADVQERSRIEGAVHVDGTARAQVAEESGFVARILGELETESGTPALINTSFNGPGEPIVNTGTEAVGTATRLGLDFVVVEDVLLSRAAPR